MTAGFEPYWWCERCYAEKSPQQVTYDERCTLCGEPVEWIQTPDQVPGGEQ